MTLNVQIGDILLDDRPRIQQVLGLESEPYSESWSRIKTVDGSSLDRQIRASGWNFFFIPGEVRAMLFGAAAATKIEGALKRILKKVRRRNFNGLEVAAIETRHFLGMPYSILSAHSVHIQQSRVLETPKERKRHETDAAWARG